MEEFTVTSEKEGTTITYHMGGYLSEASKLPVMVLAPIIKINLGKIMGINSYGVRWWCQWVKPIPATTKIILSECPMVFVKSFNTVSGFLIANMEVVSFYVPFYSPRAKSAAITQTHHSRAGQCNANYRRARTLYR